MKTLSTHSNWLDAAQALEASGQDYVLVTVLGTRGSTPRDSATKMVFSREGCFGTIGGGHLEQCAGELAATLIGSATQRVEYFPLGPKLGQCCGGSTSVLFESFVGSRITIGLFGAGHVGQTLAPLLAQLPCRLQWFDSREDYASEQPASLEPMLSDDLATDVNTLPPNSWYIIMTHNHQLDYAILKSAMQRGDAHYIGMIGSQTKWRRFQMRLAHEGVDPDQIAAVDCPIGHPEVQGKRPMEVAISVAAGVIQRYRASGLVTSVEGIPRRALQTAEEQLSSELALSSESINHE